MKTLPSSQSDADLGFHLSVFSFSWVKPTAAELIRLCAAVPVGMAVFLWSATAAEPAGERGRGGIVGRVANSDTKVYLEGVVVTLAEQGNTTVTDKDGWFSFEGVPAGSRELIGTYLGLDSQRTPVQVKPGERVNVLIELRSSIYRMAEFIVSGEREGNAASITRQRNSANVRTVLALDALGGLPSENMGELLIRMPGVGGGLNEEGVIATVSVRSTPPALNTLTIDGDTQPGSSTTDRTQNPSPPQIQFPSNKTLAP
ncbi:MAG: hypothetical protein RL077_4037 [Verrucomicrobiota bacterium]|jgi:hypothetical protein